MLVGILICTLSSEAQFAQEVEVEGYTAYSHGVFFVNEEGTPVTIQEVQALYVPRLSAFFAKNDLDYPKGSYRYPNVGHIRFRIRAQGDNIAAVRYSILFYNLFNEHMVSYSIIQMDGTHTAETMEAVFHSVRTESVSQLRRGRSFCEEGQIARRQGLGFQ